MDDDHEAVEFDYKGMKIQISKGLIRDLKSVQGIDAEEEIKSFLEAEYLKEKERWEKT